MDTALARLRKRTDRDVKTLVGKELQQKIAEVRRGNYENAAEVWARAARLLSVVDKRSEYVEGLLGELRSHIELPASAVA